VHLSSRVVKRPGRGKYVWVPLSDWIQTSDGPANDAQRAALEELGAMLDHVAPEGLDRTQSHLAWSRSVVDSPQMTAEVTLEHVNHPDWRVELHVHPRGAVVYWLSAHEPVDEHDDSDDRIWTSVVIDAVAAILRGEYEVEEVRRLGQWCKTTVIDMADPDSPRSLGSTLPLWAWLLRPFPATTTRDRVDFTSP
jgi:hypothetical protein